MATTDPKTKEDKRGDPPFRTEAADAIDSADIDAIERLTKFVAMHGEPYVGASDDTARVLEHVADRRKGLREPVDKVHHLDNTGRWVAGEPAKA